MAIFRRFVSHRKERLLARQLDRIVVIDVEATCWEGAAPEGQDNEVIEIGVCTVDLSSLTPDQHESILVRPVRSKVSEFCTRLTTLTQEQVDTGVLFEEACGQLRKVYRSRDRAWASYGDYDRRQFERQCQATGVASPFGLTHLNVKNLFAISFGLHKEVGMAGALDALELPLEGTHHRGGDDARNIARILCHLLQQLRTLRSPDQGSHPQVPEHD
jgi:inhibitor of KinA sporulation pathway (predicted exonuclease)